MLAVCDFQLIQASHTLHVKYTTHIRSDARVHGSLIHLNSKNQTRQYTTLSNLSSIIVMCTI